MGEGEAIATEGAAEVPFIMAAHVGRGMRDEVGDGSAGATKWPLMRVGDLVGRGGGIDEGVLMSD